MEPDIDPLTVAVVHRDSVDAVLGTIDQFLAFDAVRTVVVADNGSSARFVGGGRARYPADIDLRTLGVVMEKNGEIVSARPSSSRAMPSSASVSCCCRATAFF